MVKLIPFPDPMQPHQFESIVRDRSRFSHMVIRTDHVTLRMKERDITFRQVLNVLRKGAIKDDPIWNAGKASFEGNLTYHGTGRAITVRCAIRDSDLFVIAVTVY